MASSTLVLRLAAPIQSWGGIALGKVRRTESAPTRSGILGLIRAAQGCGREDVDGLDALRGLGMMVRVDKPGEPLRDFHMVGGVYNGMGKPWGGRSIITERFYLSDAAFTVFLTDTEDKITEIGRALQNPTWTLSLGRKACPPDFPMLIGISPEHAEDLVLAVPMVKQKDSSRSARVHYLTHDPGGVLPRVTFDDPNGPHPFDGYKQSQRWITAVDGIPIVSTRSDLLAWADSNLERQKTMEALA